MRAWCPSDITTESDETQYYTLEPQVPHQHWHSAHDRKHTVMSTPTTATRDGKQSDRGLNPGRQQHSSTEYFDGLRGILSFIVFVRHFLLPWKADLDTGFGQDGVYETTAMSYLKLPLIRLIYSGPTVPIFFLMSGFVLSYRHLGLIRRGDIHGFALSMMSAVLRRPFRLYLPPVVATFLVALTVHFDLYTCTYDEMTGPLPRRPKRLGKLTHQLWDWCRFLEDLMSPWSWEPRNLEYNRHLWSLPRQFLASMALFLTMIGLARLRVKVRATVLVAMWFYCLHSHRWDVSLFLAGMLLAERNLARPSEKGLGKDELQVRLAGPKETLLAQLGSSRAVWRYCFIVGLYLLSFPRSVATNQSARGFLILSSISADYIYWHSVGAVMLITAMEHDPWLQRPFRSRFLRRWGSLSFSFYITHGPVLHILGYRIVPFVWSVTGKSTDLRYDLGIILSLFILTPIALTVASAFDGLVTQPCNALIRRMEMVCCE